MKMKEDQLVHEMSKCKTLAENLDEMADRLKERDAIITAKEREVCFWVSYSLIICLQIK